jgi:hypothetical protein
MHIERQCNNTPSNTTNHTVGAEHAQGSFAAFFFASDKPAFLAVSAIAPHAMGSTKLVAEFPLFT